MAHQDHAYNDFESVTARLDEIVKDVKAKDTSLERSLDLFDEAINLGSKAVELVDRTNFSPAEKERLADLSAKDLVEAQEAQGGQEASEFLAKEGQEALSAGETMATPQHQEGETVAEEALQDALDDKDDGAWSPSAGGL